MLDIHYLPSKVVDGAVVGPEDETLCGLTVAPNVKSVRFYWTASCVPCKIMMDHMGVWTYAKDLAELDRILGLTDRIS